MSRVDGKRVSLDSPAMTRIRAVLAQARGPLNAATIAQRAHVGERTFTASYQQVLQRAGMMHVAAWERSARGPYTPLFSRGAGEAPPKPQPISNAEGCRRWKEKTGYDDLRILNRALTRPRDPLLAALLGLPSRGRHAKAGTEANAAP